MASGVKRPWVMNMGMSVLLLGGATTMPSAIRATVDRGQRRSGCPGGATPTGRRWPTRSCLADHSDAVGGGAAHHGPPPRALPLGGIHGVVGMREQAIRIAAVGREARDSDAGIQVDR